MLCWYYTHQLVQNTLRWDSAENFLKNIHFIKSWYFRSLSLLVWCYGNLIKINLLFMLLLFVLFLFFFVGGGCNTLHRKKYEIKIGQSILIYSVHGLSCVPIEKQAIPTLSPYNQASCHLNLLVIFSDAVCLVFTIKYLCMSNMTEWLNCNINIWIPINMICTRRQVIFCGCCQCRKVGKPSCSKYTKVG